MSNERIDKKLASLRREYDSIKNEIATYEPSSTTEKHVMADLYYDRSIVCTHIAQEYFLKHDFIQARGYFRRASSDVYNALRKYRKCPETQKSVEECEKRLDEYDRKREFVNKASHESQAQPSFVEHKRKRSATSTKLVKRMFSEPVEERDNPLHGTENTSTQLNNAP